MSEWRDSRAAIIKRNNSQRFHLNARAAYDDTTKRKSDQLGMSFSAASHRLRRRAMWALLEELGRTDCYRCGGAMDADSYSVDHIEDWLYVDAALFWDMGNLAYSHKACNSGARRVGFSQRRGRPTVGADGTSWCFRCQSHRPVEDFRVNKAKWTGLQQECTPCRKASRKVIGSRKVGVDTKGFWG